MGTYLNDSSGDYFSENLLPAADLPSCKCDFFRSKAIIKIGNINKKSLADFILLAKLRNSKIAHPEIYIKMLQHQQ